MFDEFKSEQLENRNYRKRWDMVWFKPIIALLRYAGLRREEAVIGKWDHFR